MFFPEIHLDTSTTEVLFEKQDGQERLTTMALINV